MQEKISKSSSAIHNGLNQVIIVKIFQRPPLILNLKVMIRDLLERGWWGHVVVLLMRARAREEGQGLLSSLQGEWKVKGWVIFLKHQEDMGCILLSNIHMFQSEIKKAAMWIVPMQSQLSSSSSMKINNKCIQAIKSKARKLLSDSFYLHEELDLQGKMSNFEHPALNYTCLTIF
ncbi:hypothetical protein OG21DRAFT_1525084 [Imleria badia]|nr:hypothetical protein OG21DRAFT_1525084 [Imleria badia]